MFDLCDHPATQTLILLLLHESVNEDTVAIFSPDNSSNLLL